MTTKMLDHSTTDSKALLSIKNASKAIVRGLDVASLVFRNLSFSIYPGERLAIFGVSGVEERMLISCLSGIKPLDAGSLEHNASVSWPLGINDAVTGKLSAYRNARFAAEIYGKPGNLEAELALIQELSGATDQLFHSELKVWPGHLKDSFKLAVPLAFDFDVITVGQVSGWDHRAIHPRARRICQVFEQRIAGRTLVMVADGQSNLALDYCEEGIVLLNGGFVYRGDPEVCLELIQEENKRLKVERRKRVIKRISEMYDDKADESNPEQGAVNERAISDQDPDPPSLD
jgi:ABC-type polysaccharide/polyol phosphate transport system ATPase subunit